MDTVPRHDRLVALGLSSIACFMETAPTPRDRLGDVELGCFRLQRIIGRGSYGTTYLAEQLGFDRDAVVKVAHPELFQTRDADLIRRRFTEELQTASRVQHPNLVTLYTAGVTRDEIPAMAMEFIPGHTLEEAIQTTPRGLPAEVVAAVFRQLGDAVAALHAGGVIHRDLSPRNVMLTPQRTKPPKLTVLDFGVAKLRGRPNETMGPVGTPRYMSPEQALGRSGPASDVFAIGAMLWWALTGVEYRATALSLDDVRRDILKSPPPLDPRALVPHIPAPVADLLSLLLAPDDRERITAREFLDRWKSLSPLLGPAPDESATYHRLSTIDVGAPPSYNSLFETASPAEHRRPQPRVLVADANPITFHLLASALRRFGCRPEQTRNLDEATRAGLNAFDLVMVSTDQAGQNAAEASKRILAEYPRLWVLSVGRGSLSDTLQEAGVRDHLRLPSQLDRLGEVIEELRDELDAARPPSGSGPPTLDMTPLERLRTEDPTALREALEMFMGQVPESLARIRHSYHQGDLRASWTECDALSASALALGATQLGRLAYATAELMRQGDDQCVPGFVTEMEDEYRSVFRALMEMHSSTL